MAKKGFFHGLGPWPNIDIETVLLLFYPPKIAPQNPTVRLLGQTEGFW